MEKQILLLLLFDQRQYSKPWRKKTQNETGFVAVFGKIHAVPLVSKFTGLLLSKADLLLYIPDSRSTETSPFMVDGPHRGTSMTARTSVQPTLLFNLHRWQLSQSLGCVFISGKRRFWRLFGLAFPPTSCPHSCSRNEAEHRRYVRE